MQRGWRCLGGGWMVHRPRWTLAAVLLLRRIGVHGHRELWTEVSLGVRPSSSWGQLDRPTVAR